MASHISMYHEGMILKRIGSIQLGCIPKRFPGSFQKLYLASKKRPDSRRGATDESAAHSGAASRSAAF
eukprot:6185175-Pleurochrysis_carterae.AAC.7